MFLESLGEFGLGLQTPSGQWGRGKAREEEVTRLALESAGLALFVLCCMGDIINAANPGGPLASEPRTALALKGCASLTKMKLQGQEEFDGHSAYENAPTEELDSGPGSGPSPDTDSQGQAVPKDPLLFIQLNELLGWPQVLEWRETGR